MLIQIKNWVNGGLIRKIEADNLKKAMEILVKDGANLLGADLRGANLYEADLRGANLRGANLHRADLHGANLYGANLYGANLYGADLYGADLREWGKLVGNRPFITIGPIGSRQDYLQVFTTENGIFLKTGCFSGSIKAFEKALSKKDSGDKNLHEYHAALALVNTHYELWK